jgi:hypothetical protein
MSCHPKSKKENLRKNKKRIQETPRKEVETSKPSQSQNDNEQKKVMDSSQLTPSVLNYTMKSKKFTSQGKQSLESYDHAPIDIHALRLILQLQAHLCVFHFPFTLQNKQQVLPKNWNLVAKD